MDSSLPSPKSAKKHSPAGGYRKGEETRRRILDGALSIFGIHGFTAATTRQIADAAGVTLPAISYYFGNKEGLYLACTNDIVASFQQGTAAVASEVHAALAEDPSPDASRELLKCLFAALAKFLLADPRGQDRSHFVQREIASPGPAFEVLYAELWRPGIELATRLAVLSAGKRLSDGEAQTRMIFMLAGLTGYGSGRRVIQRAVGDWDDPQAVIAAMDACIDALAAP